MQPTEICFFNIFLMVFNFMINGITCLLYDRALNFFFSFFAFWSKKKLNSISDKIEKENFCMVLFIKHTLFMWALGYCYFESLELGAMDHDDVRSGNHNTLSSVFYKLLIHLFIFCFKFLLQRNILHFCFALYAYTLWSCLHALSF